MDIHACMDMSEDKTRISMLARICTSVPSKDIHEARTSGIDIHARKGAQLLSTDTHADIEFTRICALSTDIHANSEPTRIYVVSTDIHACTDLHVHAKQGYPRSKDIRYRYPS